MNLSKVKVTILKHRRKRDTALQILIQSVTVKQGGVGIVTIVMFSGLI